MQPTSGEVQKSSATASPDGEAAIQQYDAYAELARAQHLGPFAEPSWALYQQSPYERTPVQAAPDIVEAYVQARGLAPGFEGLVAHCASDLGVAWRVRPGGVKDANRAIVKMGGRRKALPLDLLGGTLICSTLASMYEAADYATSFFDVVSFRDRCIAPVVPSGYRDLQLTVRLMDGHLAELKVLHEIIADLDRHEHKIFEIQRGLETANREELPFVDGLVSSILAEASQQMYTQAWQQVLILEGLQAAEGDE